MPDWKFLEPPKELIESVRGLLAYHAQARAQSVAVKASTGVLHSTFCAHCDCNPSKGHEDGIAAHVAIYLKPCIDIWAAYAQFKAIKIAGVHVEKIHVSLGEMDMLADVHAPWTDTTEDATVQQRFGGVRGYETRLIGDWVNAVRQAKPAAGETGDCECCYVARTSTNICMSPDP